jgi:RNA polymerase sigma factor (TIGR02999 family)
MSDVTRILSQIESGNPQAAEDLLPLVYDELLKLAAVRMAGESPDQTLQATALVHEAYLRLVDVEKPQHWNSRGHFFGAAAEAMRRIVVDAARRRRALKRGGEADRIHLDEILQSSGEEQIDLLALDEALTKLEERHPLNAQVVKLRFFGGCTRRLVAWCGLEWEPACLAFHQNRRPVRTASMTQVRQPIYQKSVARWKNYQSALAPLFAALVDREPDR